MYDTGEGITEAQGWIIMIEYDCILDMGVRTISND